MIETPQILTTPVRDIAVIHLTVPASEIRNVMGPGLQELRAGVEAQGIAITGPWLTHHLKNPDSTFDFEIGIPVASPVKASGRIKPSQWPAIRVARTVYHGGYEGLGAAWGEFMSWIKSNGHQPAKDLWEVYSVGPESSPDSSKYRTELNRPLL